MEYAYMLEAFDDTYKIVGSSDVEGHRGQGPCERCRKRGGGMYKDAYGYVRQNLYHFELCGKCASEVAR